MSDTANQAILTTAEIEAENRLAAAAVEGIDDPFLERGDDPNPAPLPELRVRTLEAGRPMTVAQAAVLALHFGVAVEEISADATGVPRYDQDFRTD